MKQNDLESGAGSGAAFADAELARKRVFKRNKWIFSMSGIGRDMSYALIASFLLNYIQFGISLSLAQFTTLSIVIGVFGRIWDAVNDPMMGAIIEGSHLRWGKFRPWILIGALCCGLVIIVMFGIQSIPGWRFVVFMSVMYLLWESTFTINDIGYWAMLPSLSSVRSERDSVTTLTVLFAGIGAIIAQGVIPMMTVGDMRAGYRNVAIIIAAAFMLCQTVAFLGVRETPRRAEEKAEKISLAKMWRTIIRNDQVLWMTLSMLFYNIGSSLLTALAANLLYLEIGYSGTLYFYIVVAYGVTSVLVNALYPVLAKRLGRKRLQLASIITACVGYLVIAAMGWTPAFPLTIWALSAFVILVAAGQSLFYMASIVNMTNCVEYNDFRHGERNEAVVSTLRPFMAKFAAAIQTLIVTVVLAISGTFTLSQSISSLEAQRDFFSRMGGADAQAHYLESVQAYLAEFAGTEPGSPAFDAAVGKVEGRVAADAVMSSCQINPRYLLPLGDAMILSLGRDGAPATELGRVKDVDPSILRSSAAGSAFSLEVGDLPSGAVSAVNANFRDKRSLPMRIWVRMAITVLPALFLLIALYIQRRKFIIDETYYDRMIKEIAEREGAKA
jgi:melibiose permease/lactose/raffinose/galactose permease